jgi:hypothetical protein
VTKNYSQGQIFEIRGFYLYQGAVHWQESALSVPYLGQDKHVSVSVEVRMPGAVYAAPDMCGVTFRDSDGRYWARYASGHLVRLSTNPEDDLKRREWVGP